MMTFYRNIGVVIFSTLLIAGCDREFVPVQGRIAFQEKPLASGTVAFYPITDGTPGYASIVNGSYAVKTGTKHGLRPGEYRVTVAAYAKPAVGDAGGRKGSRLALDRKGGWGRKGK